MTTHQGIQPALRDVEQEHADERSVERRPCQTVVAECTEAPAQVRALRMA
jgi:hypothetical protein